MKDIKIENVIKLIEFTEEIIDILELLKQTKESLDSANYFKSVYYYALQTGLTVIDILNIFKENDVLETLEDVIENNTLGLNLEGVFFIKKGVGYKKLNFEELIEYLKMNKKIGRAHV
jgi:hypothetical protein